MSTSQIAEPTLPVPPAARRETVELDVTGMSCGSCAARVQRALGGLPGVQEALVNYATGRATVELDPRLAGTEQLLAAVERAGYAAAPAAASAGEQARAFAELERA
ncbi:MAG TPA: heavy metal-associated domain-containing protein, partial [Solirubrobacteraceae bacterium]|nr:heavy metal-associated domain-containing protein [Solirubrobacteraceae bacterium]